MKLIHSTYYLFLLHFQQQFHVRFFIEHFIDKFTKTTVTYILL